MCLGVPTVCALVPTSMVCGVRGVEIDAIDGLVALGLVSSEQAAAAASIADADLGRLGRLAVVGVDVGALVPTIAAIARIPVATADVLGATAAPALPPAAQTVLRALPACPVTRPDGTVEVVLSDPTVRPHIAALLGPMFRASLAREEQVRALCARFLTAATAPSAAPAPATAQPTAAVAAPRAPTVASHEMAAFVEAPRARVASMSQEAMSTALAEPVDLSDSEKWRILELDARIDQASPAELLGIAPGTSADDIKERYYQLSRAFHPDAHFRRELGSYKARSQRVFRALKKACDTLVAEAEQRDHLDLATPAAEPRRPAPNTPATAIPIRPISAGPPAGRDVDPVRARPPTPAAGVSLELDGPVRASSVPRPRTAAMAPPPSSMRGSDRRVVVVAAVVAALVIVAGIAALAIRGGAKAQQADAADPAARPAQLVDRARAASLAGDHAEAIAFATEAIKLDATSLAAARALAVRGRAFVDIGDRAEGFVDLEAAVGRLPAGDAVRTEAEALLRRHRR